MRIKELSVMVLVCFCITAVEIYGNTTNYWNGAVSSSWSDEGNWDPEIPESTDDVYFDGVVINSPLLSEDTTVHVLKVLSSGWTFDGDDGAGGYKVLYVNPGS